MRESVNQDKSDIDQYGFRPLEREKKRLDLNDLLRRAKSQKKDDRKFNLQIFFGATIVVGVLYLLLSF